MAQVFAEHRCMMKTVQNFKDLANGIDNLFVPVPYTSVGEAKVFPDLVVIYTYEPSRNLNVTNSEYTNDGFMLNDEYDTPLPIKSRGDSNNCYKIPAFGVSYGRQYQSYFKDVNVNMSRPVITQQAIIAKANILEASRGNGVFKGVTAQDLYDIYSNQSYTCTFEMMGCAWVQPMMYFVLLTHARTSTDADEGEDNAAVANLHVVLNIGEWEYLYVVADFRLWRYLSFWTYFACHNFKR